MAEQTSQLKDWVVFETIYVNATRTRFQTLADSKFEQDQAY